MVNFRSKPNETQQLTIDVTLLKQVKDHVAGLICPFCGEKLILRGFEKGPKGYVAQIACACGLGGVADQTGFKFQHLPRQAK